MLEPAAAHDERRDPGQDQQHHERELDPQRRPTRTPPRELAAIMADCGLGQVRWVLTAGGIIAMHVGEVV